VEYFVDEFLVVDVVDAEILEGKRTEVGIVDEVNIIIDLT
jgi:hypothetical protein